MSRGEASGRRGSESAGASAPPEMVALPDLPTTPGGGFDFSSILAVADMLPVMIAYMDADHRLRFVNRPLAEWFERSRSSILGLTVRELEELLLQAQPYVGWPAVSTATTAVIEVLRERGLGGVVRTAEERGVL